MRKLFHVFLSLVIVYASTTSAFAASPVGWSASPLDVVMNGAQATITAIKGKGSSALQSTIRHAPTAANVGKKILKGGGLIALGIAVTQTLGDGVDWVLDPANNRVIYKEFSTTSKGNWYYTNKNKVYYVDPAIHCPATFGLTFYASFSESLGKWACTNGSGGVKEWYSQDTTIESIEKYLPISTLALKVISNALNDDVQSQELIKSVAIDDVNSGFLDTSFNISAIPVADTPPVVDPNAPPRDPTLPAPPFDASSVISAIKSVMSGVVNMSGILGAKFDLLLVDLGLQNAETQKVINDSIDRAITAGNTDKSDIVAAIEAIEGNTLDGQVINDAIDRAIADGKTSTSDIVAAIEAIEGNTLDGQVINDAIDRVIEAVADADAVADARALEAIEADDARALEAIEADDARAKAKADADAEFMNDTPPENPPQDVPVDVIAPTNGASDFDVNYINFGGQCPVLPSFSIGIGGASSDVAFDMSPLCSLAVAIRPAIIAMAYFIGLGIVASSIRGS